MKNSIIVLVSVFISLASYAKGDGPVATVCKTDIEKFCADKQHVAREVRTCLETKKTEISKECLQVLENTGPGSGMGKGKKK
ncbi:MAG: hypothetical protein B7Y39_12790 [Bdellovibrio sp. 28-41-41]|nr:MAG: hypothetical protein B7Y39_12790 [Bdellovibrio sp. 28-41-41]